MHAGWRSSRRGRTRRTRCHCWCRGRARAAAPACRCPAWTREAPPASLACRWKRRQRREACGAPLPRDMPPTTHACMVMIRAVYLTAWSSACVSPPLEAVPRPSCPDPPGQARPGQAGWGTGLLCRPWSWSWARLIMLLLLHPGCWPSISLGRYRASTACMLAGPWQGRTQTLNVTSSQT